MKESMDQSSLLGPEKSTVDKRCCLLGELVDEKYRLQSCYHSASQMSEKGADSGNGPDVHRYLIAPISAQSLYSVLYRERLRHPVISR